jgi:hypothetical protein
MQEAVAFIWLGDEEADPTLYVAFSPLRFRSQFLKIICAGDVNDGLQLPQEVPVNCKDVTVPVSSYVVSKLRKLWGRFRLRDHLLECVEQHSSKKVVFAGISHGASLAQAAALQFQLWCGSVEAYVVTWNSYRWTNEVGVALMEEHFQDRILAFALSRVKTEPQATRYWDSVTGFPERHAPMPNMVLLDADSGLMFEHKLARRPMGISIATGLMRMSELHFASVALAATKKATAAACGADGEEVEDDGWMMSPMREKFQQKVLHTSQRIAEAHQNFKASKEEYAGLRFREKVEKFRSARTVAFEKNRRTTSFWKYIVFCGRV